MLHPLQPNVPITRPEEITREIKTFPFIKDLPVGVSRSIYEGTIAHSSYEGFPSPTLRVLKTSGAEESLPCTDEYPFNHKGIFEDQDGIFAIKIKDLISSLNSEQNLFGIFMLVSESPKRLTSPKKSHFLDPDLLLDSNNLIYSMHILDKFLKRVHVDSPTSEWMTHYSNHFFVVDQALLKLNGSTHPKLDLPYYERESIYKLWDSRIIEFKELVLERFKNKDCAYYNDLYRDIMRETSLFS